jgi:hypothetical protein
MTVSEAKSAPRPHRRWFQYRLRTLLLLTLLVSIGMSWIAVKRPQPAPCRRQDEILAIYGDIRQGKTVPLARVERALGPSLATKSLNEQIERRLYARRGDRYYLVVFFDRASNNATDGDVVSPYSY